MDWNSFFETILSTETEESAESLTMGNLFLVIGISFLCGIIIAGGYMLCRRKEGYQTSFILTILVMPVLTSMVIFFVGNKIARAFSIAGIFSIVRFRSMQTNPRDIAYIFFSVCTGLICGLGYVAYAVVVAVVLSVVMFLISLINFGEPKKKSMELKISVPEELNFDNVFDDIIKKYTLSYKLARIKTSDYGSLYVLSYYVVMSADADTRALIDELRVKNGNMDIALTVNCPEREAVNL
ncbi:MAG TPA: DUF4956 domain-containing protein [Bacillota bacterium]|nr:DUF4956 domain-containing protein [Bacillota bacterium]